MRSTSATAAKPPHRAAQQLDFCIVHEFPGPSLELAWRDCLDRVDAPAHYNAPEYFRDPKQGDERRFAVLATKDSRVTGVLTGAHDGDQAICGLISRPQLCVDKTADTAGTGESLARGLLAEASTAKLLTVYSWFPLEGFTRYGFRERVLEGVVVLDLTRGPEALFKQLDKKRRNCIRSAMRQPVEIVEAATEQDITAFYAVYSCWFGTTRKKIGGRKLSAEFFQQRFRLRENVRAFLARSGGQVIAGVTLRFFPGGLVEYSNNSSLDAFLHLKPNDLLLWNAIEWACREGFPRFSLGGAHRFLREFGGRLTPIYRYRLDRTRLRRHDLREGLTDWGRATLRQMPRPLETAVRKIAGKGLPKNKLSRIP
ncbi:MAG: GNAT family N-acetyltransferase [Terriglobales bacterium]